MNKNFKLEELNIIEIQKKIGLEAEKTYPLTREELKAKYSLEANKKFNEILINSKVTVEYKQGRYKYKITGKFYGFTHELNGIRVGRTVIPLFDLLPKDKIRFNKKLRKQKKKEYVYKCISNYLSIKRNYEVKEVKNSIDAIYNKNREAAYIYAWQKWRTPQEVAEIIIKHYISNKDVQ